MLLAQPPTCLGIELPTGTKPFPTGPSTDALKRPSSPNKILPLSSLKYVLVYNWFIGNPSVYLNSPRNSLPVPLKKINNIEPLSFPTSKTFVDKNALFQELVHRKLSVNTGVTSISVSRPRFCKEALFCFEFVYPEVLDRVTSSIWSVVTLSKAAISSNTLLLNNLASRPISFSVTVKGCKKGLGAKFPLTPAVVCPLNGGLMV